MYIATTTSTTAKYCFFLRTFRYHLGTLAFGSLIIAIIRMIRLIIEYIEQKLREKNQDNKVVKVNFL